MSTTPPCQFFTPLWVAEALVERHFKKLDAADHVLEPSCGPGAFLRAVPQGVPATGIELDACLAEWARADTGRTVLTGDFRTVPIDFRPTAIIGNPPFVGSTFDQFLDRAHDLLPDGAKAGFILPTYLFQTAGRVVRYSERWSLSLEMMPRNAFHTRMRTPLVFALFSKDRRALMVGLALYDEAHALTRMAAPYRAMLSGQKGSAWRAVCKLALERLGGVADLATIYAELEHNRPTRTTWWREKVRQTLRVYSETFDAIETGRYALREVA